MSAARGIIKTELWFHVYHVERYMHAVTSENDSIRTAHKAHNNQVNKKIHNSDVYRSHRLRLVKPIHVSKTMLYFKTLRGGLQMQVTD